VFGGLGVKNKKLMREMILSLFPDIPLIFDLNFGHTTPNISIPIGVDCRIDFEKGVIGFFFSNKDRKYSIKF
jgi:muramoyltetrapeptide carboxypeptidase LdcA involved in peptidoglycan recycling